jgi:starch phosphorylase
MKVLVNGGVNLSILDGWWAEAYAPEVGWAIGDGQEHGDDPAWDHADALALYDVLEREVIPGFYARDAAGIPSAWVARMRESMARLTPMFSSLRAVREYTEQCYLPACTRYRQRLADQGAKARQIVDWRRALEQHWSSLRFGELKVASSAQGHVFEIELALAGLAPDSVAVELYADAAGEQSAFRQPMTRTPAAASSGAYVYGCSVTGQRPASDYTPRVIPRFDGVAVPLEAGRILWQR